MTYSTTAYRLLISSPGDVVEADRDTVIRTINRWNVIYGQRFGAVVVPVYWQAHSAAEHGRRPQESLNAQLVEPADVVLALFWHRLGTSTGVADSGTVEEIEEADRRGAYVAILLCERDFPQSADPNQLKKLRTFYRRMRDRSLMLGYSSEGELAQHVDAVLSKVVGTMSGRAEVEAGSPNLGAEVWPRVESTEHLETDSKGRARTRRRWTLVLDNTGSEPAHDVSYRLEAESEEDMLPHRVDDERKIEVLAPGGQAQYGLFLHSGVAPQARCSVSWRDASGEHTNQATLRFF